MNISEIAKSASDISYYSQSHWLAIDINELFQLSVNTEFEEKAFFLIHKTILITNTVFAEEIHDEIKSFKKKVRRCNGLNAKFSRYLHDKAVSFVSQKSIFQLNQKEPSVKINKMIITVRFQNIWKSRYR